MMRLMTMAMMSAALSSAAAAQDAAPRRRDDRPPSDVDLVARYSDAPANARSRVVERSIGPFDLRAFSWRLKRGPYDESLLAVGPERYRARKAGLSLSTSLFGPVGLRTEALLSNSRRRFALSPVAYPARSTTTTAVGAGLALDDGPALMLDYVRTTVAGRSSPLERMVEIAGGAPMTGDGLRLALTREAQGGAAGSLGWSLSATSMRRPAREAGFDPGQRGFSDTRAELAVWMAF